MNPSTTLPPPVAATHVPAPGRLRRLTGIDMARGLAIIGMIAVHSLIPDNQDGTPTLMYTLSAGHASTLFAVLAGVAIAFLTGRTALDRNRASLGSIASLATRAALIGLIGLALGYTDMDYGVVILVYYAAMFLLAIPLAYLGTRALVAVTALGAIVAPLVSQWARPSMPESLGEQISLGHLLTSPGDVLLTVFITGEFPVIVWMTFVGMGLVVGRLALHTVRTPALLAVTGAVMVGLGTAVSWVFMGPLGGRTALDAVAGVDEVQEILMFGADGTTPTDSWWWLAVRSPHTGTTLDVLATAGGAIATIGVCLLLFRLPWPVLARAVRIATAPLVAIGTMSLTVYVAHIMFINSDFDQYTPLSGFLRQLIVICIAAIVWKATAGRGPLEGLIRSVTGRAKAVVDRRMAPTPPRA